MLLHSIGGSIPIVVAYGAEFTEKKHRGWRMGLLVMTWSMGGVYCAAFGWLIVPNADIVLEGAHGEQHWGSWRAFILVCAVPAVMAIVGLIFMPESARFLLQVNTSTHFRSL